MPTDAPSSSGLKGMSSETKKRVVVGLGGAAGLVLLIVLGGHFGVGLLAAIVGTLMCKELAHVFYQMSDRKEKTMALLGTSWIVIFINILFPKVQLECLVLSFMGMFAYYLATAERHAEDLRRHLDELIYTTFALVYVVTLMAFFPLIRDGLNGVRWVILFLLIVWAGDTGAWFFGKRYGKQKLYPLISPGKSVEGSAGGLASSILVALLFKFLFFKNLSWFGALITAVLVGIVSQIGDLCESFFKRSYKMKDSGNILPGHGGMLDRFDGVLFSLPLMYFCVKLFG